MSQQRRDWDEIGRLDALWAILSDPAKRHGRWDVDEFFATGRREIDTMLETARDAFFSLALLNEVMYGRQAVASPFLFFDAPNRLTGIN